MTCECEVCVYGRQVHKHLSDLPEPQRTFFENMYESLAMLQDEVAYYKAIAKANGQTK